MDTKGSTACSIDAPPPGYETAMTEIEQRAARGELTLSQVRREIFALRERFAAEAWMVMRWAAQTD